jgi:hypothetical protein
MKAKIRVQFSVIVDGQETGEAIEYFEDVEISRPEIGDEVWPALFVKFREKYGLRVWNLLIEALLKFFDYNEVK